MELPAAAVAPKRETPPPNLARNTLRASDDCELVRQLRFVGIDWSLLAGFLAFAVAGMVAGSSLSSRLTENRLRRVFAGTVLFLAVAVGFGNLLL